MRILIAEDDERIAEPLSRALGPQLLVSLIQQGQGPAALVELVRGELMRGLDLVAAFRVSGVDGELAEPSASPLRLGVHSLVHLKVFEAGEQPRAKLAAVGIGAAVASIGATGSSAPAFAPVSVAGAA